MVVCHGLMSGLDNLHYHYQTFDILHGAEYFADGKGGIPYQLYRFTGDIIASAGIV